MVHLPSLARPRWVGHNRLQDLCPGQCQHMCFCLVGRILTTLSAGEIRDASLVLFAFMSLLFFCLPSNPPQAGHYQTPRVWCWSPVLFLGAAISHVSRLVFLFYQTLIFIWFFLSLCLTHNPPSFLIHLYMFLYFTNTHLLPRILKNPFN